MNVQRHPTFLPISDHNVVTSSARLLGRFAHNRRAKSVKNPSIGLQCVMTDPDVRREVAAVVAKQLQESTDEIENECIDAIVRAVELVIPQKRHKRAGSGSSGDTQL